MILVYQYFCIAEELEKFLTPVKLDPGLETVDDEDFRKLQKAEELEKNPPNDRFRLVYLIMVIHGIGILMPWNMFINAKDYFENYKLNSTVSPVKEYQKNFLYYVGLASQIPNVFMSLVNFCCQCGGSASVRIVISLLVMVIIFIVTASLAMIDSSDWQSVFFIVTMISVVILNMAAGVYQNSMYGLAAILPMKYTNAIVFGNNFSGTLIAVINIISISGAPNIRTAAIYYFVAAIVILLVAFDAYFILPLTKFYRHFCTIVELKQAAITEKGDETCLTGLKRYWFVFKKIWVMVFCVWFVFFVTLALFPAIQSDIRRINFPISDAYWAPIFCFLNFNFFAMLGNFVTEFIKFPGPRFVWIPVLLRVLIFIPIFLLCNYLPRGTIRGIPVYIPNDYVYIVTAALMAFTSGYYSSLVMMYAPKLVAPEYAGTAGMMMALFLVLGISCGVNFSIVLTMIVEKIQI
ncbi:hypothetical protein LOTGIDRAFT_117641 [Lottia gigantea]|uniref:Equilibrative nucleoside transporter 1 n=1 Tax=Lottia gigantea TaxID=225164 RepID=V4AE23_LOTGI|nr:hypothetical protein LOTGIDRAFT_117641 [Lottia gigantea]ESO95122.1 hypothetical protein LOTGIDRAFT_117641 [Lottia gigantea]